MNGKKTDLLGKGAIVQRDYETYAIAPHLPGGICTPQVLKKIAEVAEKYKAKALKLTSAQRIAIVGINESLYRPDSRGRYHVAPGVSCRRC